MYKVYAQSISGPQKTVVEVGERTRLSEAFDLKRKLSCISFGGSCHLYRIYDTNLGRYIKEIQHV